MSVDCSDPEAAVFTCYLCSCQSNLCTCAASPRYQQGDAWACSKAVHPATTMVGDSVQQDSSVNQGGYQQQDGSALLVRFGGIASASASTGGSVQQDGAAQQGGYEQQGQPYELPYPWEQLADPSSGQVYYSNPQTGEASWDPPQ